MKTVSQAISASGSDALTFAQLLEAHMPKKLTQNTLVQGTIIAITREGALVDIGSKTESVLSTDEAAEFGLTIGSSGTFLIMSEPNEDGQSFLSLKSALGWSAATELFQSQGVTEVTVKSLSRPGGKHIAGAIVDLNGARGFIPASQIAVRGKALDNLPGTKLSVKVGWLVVKDAVSQTETLKAEAPDLANGKLILSNRAAVRDLKDKFFATVEEGSIVTGTVSGFGTKKLTSGDEVEYGVFVDLGNGVSGLVHKSEISGDRTAIPSSILKLGQTVDLVVLPGIDRVNLKVSLSLKKARSSGFLSSVKEGDVVTGKAVRKADFGWFIELGEGAIDGLLFKWEIAAAEGMDSICKGQSVTAVVKSLDKAAEKLGLTTKDLPTA